MKTKLKTLKEILDFYYLFIQKIKIDIFAGQKASQVWGDIISNNKNFF